MTRRLILTDENWGYGCYPRVGYKTDVLYTFYQYRDFLAFYNKGRIEIQDQLMEDLCRQGCITQETKERYVSQLLAFAKRPSWYDLWPVERIYGEIHSLRRKFAGARLLEELYAQRMCQKVVLPLPDGIDQSARKRRLFDERRAFILALCQAELFGLMQSDIGELLARGKQVYLLSGEEPGSMLPGRAVLEERLRDLPVKDVLSEEKNLHYLVDEEKFLGLNLAGISWEEELQKRVDEGQAALLVYGEDGFLHCRNLKVASVVHAIPQGYCARAMTNQMDEDAACVVYVPEHFDITKFVRLTEKTVISYWQLAKLWETCGDDIYHMTVDELYLKYPQYFLNIYAGGKTCREAEPDYPIQLHWPSGPRGKNVLESFYRMREAAVRAYFDRHEDMRYISAYFDGDMEEVEIPWGSHTQQTGILVHGIRTSCAQKSRVVGCDDKLSLRQQFAGEKASLLIMSNFLFFMTPKLIRQYNELRSERPREQLGMSQCHLDYMLCPQKDGRRVETFPLFRKACIAMKEDGSFLFFHYRLGGGRLSLNGHWLGWDKSDVNDVSEKDHGEVKIYTPYYTYENSGEPSDGYRVFVGAGRINVVIVLDQVICIRRGDVVLPSAGVVVSLSREKGETMLAAVGCRELEDGYYDCGNLELQVVLDAPEQVSPEQWSRVKWAMGGGMSLIWDGQSIYEGDDAQVYLKEEGWLCPLSRQTQETAIHELVKHPRTAIGVTQNGDMFILVFSGRTKMSTGADYREMCRIARKLFPDVRCMMNVDGGSSSMLGMAIRGNFMELSYPATSFHSCAGMVRRIDTVLCVEQ